MRSFFRFWVLLAVLWLSQLSAGASDVEAINRQLDGQVRKLKKLAFRSIEKKLGLKPIDEKKLIIEFRDLPPKYVQERKIQGSDLEISEDGMLTVVVYREFARAQLIDIQGEITYQLARALWRQNYPHRTRVAAWFLHGLALHASGLGDERILFVIADNEKKTVSLVDGWEGDRSHNDRDHVDDILFFRFLKEDQGTKGIHEFLRRVGEGEEPHRVMGDPYPGGFKSLEQDWKRRAKEVIDEMSSRGLEEFRQVYAAYQDANKTKERAKMTNSFMKLLVRYPRSFWEGKARYYLGQCWLAADREDKALTQFKIILEDLARSSDPRFIDMAKYRLGLMYYERHKVNQAIRTFQEYLRDFAFGKYLSQVHFALAEIYHQKRKVTKADEHLNWILKNDPNSATAKKARKLKKELG